MSWLTESLGLRNKKIAAKRQSFNPEITVKCVAKQKEVPRVQFLLECDLFSIFEILSRDKFTLLQPNWGKKGKNPTKATFFSQLKKRIFKKGTKNLLNIL